MYSFIAENIIYPMGDLALGTSVMRYYRWLQKTQWWSPEQLVELQNEKLKNLIKHAYTNVPYYRNMFDTLDLPLTGIQNVQDLGKLPILTKDKIRANTEQFIATDFKKYKPIRNATGGSTGEPLIYFITKDLASINWAGMFRGFGWGGYRIGDKRITFGGSSLIPDKKTSITMRIRQKLERNLPLSAVSMTQDKYVEYIDILKKYKPKYIYGYPSSIFLLADYCKEHRVTDIKFNAVFTTAEVLLPNYRDVIEKQFNCKVFDQYGSYDGGGQALECNIHKGLHVTAEKCILEIVDEAGNLVSPGQSGRIIVTDLHNYAMPFIRYEVGDIGAIDDKLCECGRGLPLLKNIQGRTTDIIKFANGTTLAGPAVTLIFKDCHVKQYQVVQSSGNSIMVKVVKAPGYSDNDTDYYMNIFKHHLGNEIKIDLEFCDEIKPGKNGKYRFIINRLEQ